MKKFRTKIQRKVIRNINWNPLSNSKHRIYCINERIKYLQINRPKVHYYFNSQYTLHNIYCDLQFIRPRLTHFTLISIYISAREETRDTKRESSIFRTQTGLK